MAKKTQAQSQQNTMPPNAPQPRILGWRHDCEAGGPTHRLTLFEGVDAGAPRLTLVYRVPSSDARSRALHLIQRALFKHRRWLQLVERERAAQEQQLRPAQGVVVDSQLMTDERVNMPTLEEYEQFMLIEDDLEPLRELLIEQVVRIEGLVVEGGAPLSWASLDEAAQQAFVRRFSPAMLINTIDHVYNGNALGVLFEPVKNS